MSNTYIANWRRWHEAGFTSELLPISPPGATLAANTTVKQSSVGKVPCVKNDDGTWNGYGGWSGVHAQESHVKMWSGWNAGVGMQGRNYSGVDVDVSDDEIARASATMAIEAFGPAPIRYREGSPRSLLMYRTDEVMPKRRLAFSIGDQEHAVEFLARGQYYNCDGMHPNYNCDGMHPKGQPYRWLEDAEHKHPCDLKPEGLTKITGERVDKFFAALEEYVEFMGGEITDSSSARVRDRDENAGQRLFDQDDWTIRKIENWLASKEEGSVLTGTIDDTCFEVAAMFVDWAAEYDTVVEHLVQWSEKCCDVAMELDRIQVIAGSALRNRDTARSARATGARGFSRAGSKSTK